MKTKKAYRKRRKAQVRRQRMILCVLTLILVLAVSFGISSFYSNAKDVSISPVKVKYYKSVQIQKGDSLWSIAETYMNSDYHSIYDYMEELVTLNQLDGHEVDQLQEGDYLTVAYYAEAGR